MGRRPCSLSVLQRFRLLARPLAGRLRQMGGVVVQVPGLVGQREALRALAVHARHRQTKRQETPARLATFELESVDRGFRNASNRNGQIAIFF